MSTSKLAALRAAYSTQEKENTGDYVNNYYPFWDMKIGERCVVRFLPDKDRENTRGMLVEKLMHNLMINGQKKSVACLSMYDEPCPICKVAQDYYKVKDEVNGKKYYRKKQYIAQAVVVEDPLAANKDGETHTGKVRYLNLGFQIYGIIKDAFASDDLEEVPYDFEGGYDFVIKKTENGKYDSYAIGTKFANKQRALTDEEFASAEEGMIVLKTLLPKNPGLEKVEAMLNADLNGEDYVDGNDAKKTSPARTTGDDDVPFENAVPARRTPAAAPAKASPAEKVAAPAATEAAGGSSDVDDMLAAIRARRAAAAAK